MLQFYIMGVYKGVFNEENIPAYIKEAVLKEVEKLRKQDEKNRADNEKIAEQVSAVVEGKEEKSASNEK